jgi:hypothetical protein
MFIVITHRQYLCDAVCSPVKNVVVCGGLYCGYVGSLYVHMCLSIRVLQLHQEDVFTVIVFSLSVNVLECLYECKTFHSNSSDFVYMVNLLHNIFYFHHGSVYFLIHALQFQNPLCCTLCFMCVLDMQHTESLVCSMYDSQ